MPRTARKYNELKVYHVILRGIDRQDIFLDDEDREKFLDLLQERKEKFDFEIYGYCLMDNHIHLIIYDKEMQLSKLMQSISISYVFYFNKKYQRIGHLFQNRFFSKKIEDSAYLLQACRYIHQNPSKAGIEKMENYEWSSYNEYIKKEKIVNSKFILTMISKKEFIEFHKFNQHNLFEFEMGEKLTDEQLIQNICEYLNINNIHSILEKSIPKRNEILEKIKENIPVQNTQLARVLGINRKAIQRALKK